MTQYLADPLERAFQGLSVLLSEERCAIEQSSWTYLEQLLERKDDLLAQVGKLLQEAPPGEGKRIGQQYVHQAQANACLLFQTLKTSQAQYARNCQHLRTQQQGCKAYKEGLETVLRY